MTSAARSSAAGDTQLDDARAAALEEFLKANNREQLGVSRLTERRGLDGSDLEAYRPEVIPTGVTTVDVALGVGGFPRGRIVEAFGPEGGGKTALALRVVAEAQKRGEPALFVDAEHALDPLFARKLGVDIDALYYETPTIGEEGLHVVDRGLDSGAFAVIVVDSVAALTPRKEVEGRIGDDNVGLQARMMSQAMRRFAAKVDKTSTVLIFVNQTRTEVGKMFGDPTVTPGGKALKFAASLRLALSAPDGQRLKDGKDFVGSRITARVKKNKVAAPFREAQYNLYYDGGIDLAEALREGAAVAGVITRRGNAYYDADSGELLARSKNEFDELVDGDRDLFERLASSARDAMLDRILAEAFDDEGGGADESDEPDGADGGDGT